MAAKRASRSTMRLRLRRGHGKRFEAGPVWNVSLGGVFVEMVEPLPFGEDLGLEFELAGRPEPIACQGFVVWSTRDAPDKAGGKSGVAIRLTSLGIADEFGEPHARSIEEFYHRPVACTCGSIVRYRVQNALNLIFT